MSLIVLVVDDNEADQFLSDHALNEYDPSILVYKAYDGKEAIDLIESKECIPDYIFLDINMPRMNGIEFLEAYGCLNITNSTIIVMLTSSIREDEHKQCLAYPYVKMCSSKPLTVEGLAKCLQS